MMRIQTFSFFGVCKICIQNETTRLKKLDQRTNGPVNAHLSLLHIPINMFEYYGI